MPDWTRSMQQTYEFYEVDPITLHDIRPIENVTSNEITRDAESETLGSASLECDGDLMDKYVRTYLITLQDSIRDRIPLGCYIYGTSSLRFDGYRQVISHEGYTPLSELKEKPPPVGYALNKGLNIMATAAQILGDKEVYRLPFVSGTSDKNLVDNFASQDGDTWLTFLTDLAAAGDHTLGLDELGRLIFVKKTDVSVMTPTWTFTDDNASILMPSVELKRDIYEIPNVVEVIYSSPKGGTISVVATNDDPDSIVSTVNRGRKIVYRDTDPSIASDGTTLSEEQLQEYADNELKEMSSLEYSVSYTHGYCPVRLGDCVMLNYPSAGLNNVKAKVTKQIIRCESGCSVQETAVYTKKLWEQ